MPAAAAQPGPTRPLIEPASKPPKPVGVPAVLPADTAHRSKDRSGWQRDGNLALVAEDGAAGPVRVAWHRTGHRPMRLHQVCLHLAERGVNGLANIEAHLRNEARDPVVPADHFVLETFGQRTGNAMAQRRDELNPM